MLMWLNFSRQYEKIIYLLIIFLGIAILQSIFPENLQAQKPLTRTERIKGRPAYGREKLACTTLLKTKRKKSTFGVRVGIPISITFKTYSKTLWSFELAAGINYATGFSNASIGEIFLNNKPTNVDNATYLSHQIKLPLAFQAKIIRHFSLFRIPGVVFFTGFGVHVFSGTINYVYSIVENITATSTERRSGTGTSIKDHTVSVMGVGPEVQVGLEYYFPSRIPLVAYLEGGVYYDVLNPTSRGLLFLGGTGIRISF